MTPTLESPDDAIICACDRAWQELRVRESVERGRVRRAAAAQPHPAGVGLLLAAGQ